MNAAQAQQLIGSEKVVQDRTRIFGYSAGTPGMLMDAKKSNLDCNPIEGGRLLMFSAGKDSYLGGTNPNGSFKQVHVDLMPSEYAKAVNDRFRMNDDTGFRLLPMLTSLNYRVWVEDGKPMYQDDADAYFQVVHPPLTAPCPFGLNQAIPHHNPEVGSGSHIYTPCATCRLAELQSEACSERIYNASTTLDSAILLKLRETLIESNQAAIKYMEAKSSIVHAEIATALAGGGGIRRSLNTVDRIHLRQLHKEENAQTNTQLDAMKTFAQEMASAVRGVAPVAPTVEAPVDRRRHTHRKRP